MSTHRIGLALSGGGARGMVHVGVLQALEENNIKPDIISGTSAGSIVGSLYCKGFTPAEIKDLSKGQSLFKLAGLKIPGKGFVSHSSLRKMLSKYLEENDFSTLKLPFHVAVANINTGEAEVWSSGPLIDLVVASSSIPVMFEPVVINGSTYVDGGLLMNLPAMPIRPLCKVLISVNLVPRVRVPSDELASVLSVGGRCFDLSALNNIKPHLAAGDILIEPEAIHQYSRFNFSDLEKMYQIGYEETLEHIDKIHSALAKHKIDVS